MAVYTEVSDAALAAFLIGEGAGYLTGAVLPVDGGLTAMMGVHRS